MKSGSKLRRLAAGSRFPIQSCSFFVHEGSSKRPLDFSVESSGTRKLFNIAGDWWTLANEAVTLLVDELSANLHPDCLTALSGRSTTLRQTTLDHNWFSPPTTLDFLRAKMACHQRSGEISVLHEKGRQGSV